MPVAHRFQRDTAQHTRRNHALRHKPLIDPRWSLVLRRMLSAYLYGMNACVLPIVVRDTSL
ncbi:MAG: hypothetical protein DDT32_01867 [Syntrophomonadaceae bacterium]|nr:hypothetical protein [Bacillota bacterium]